MIALLAMRPVRRRALLSMTVTAHLREVSDGYELRFASKDMKDQKARSLPLPKVLVLHMQAYLDNYRPLLLGDKQGSALRINQYGDPITEDGLSRELPKITGRLFGVALRPHGFRHMRAAIYTRYSTDLQTDTSIEDQHRLCARLITGNGWREAETYADHAISGSTHLRPAYQRLMKDARNHTYEVVVAEGLDRIARDQEHIAAFFKQMRFRGIQIVTVAEGEISELHIGLKGTMSSLFLKDLAQKNHRGLEGRARKGKSAGGVTYGYDVVRTPQANGEMSTGERIINENQAQIVRAIFKDYANGISPRAIAAALNKDGVAGPRTSGLGASTIYGNHKRG